ncbi:MAG: dihydroorotate dehydrogenase 2, partial [Bdellovibrionales bacterium]|nr:dihydroorotate dehydrogenase 2 [Bdellovibrionales bacterium]
MIKESFLELFLDKFRPWMWINPAVTHDWMSPLLNTLCFTDESLNSIKPEWAHWNSYSWRGLEFRNPVGIAGGVDKTAANINNWWQLGVGFVELGTITPLFQEPNPGKILDRSIKFQSLWNKMGFPHPGYKESLFNLDLNFNKRPTPVLINLGKNRWTPNEKAHEDYIFLMHHLHSVADIFVINISSPNTKGLRELFQRKNLKPFLTQIYQTAVHYQKPILLKISPDENNDDLNLILDISLEVGIDGFIVTNTTLRRNDQLGFPTDGGVSGRYLA